MMTSSIGNVFRVTGPLCGEFTGPGEFPTQRPVTRSEALMFSLICVWINGWVNNREAGDLRCNRGHYDVTVMTQHMVWFNDYSWTGCVFTFNRKRTTKKMVGQRVPRSKRASECMHSIYGSDNSHGLDPALVGATEIFCKNAIKKLRGILIGCKSAITLWLSVMYEIIKTHHMIPANLLPSSQWNVVYQNYPKLFNSRHRNMMRPLFNDYNERIKLCVFISGCTFP